MAFKRWKITYIDYLVFSQTSKHTFENAVVGPLASHALSPHCGPGAELGPGHAGHRVTAGPRGCGATMGNREAWIRVPPLLFYPPHPKVSNGVQHDSTRKVRRPGSHSVRTQNPELCGEGLMRNTAVDALTAEARHWKRRQCAFRDGQDLRKRRGAGRPSKRSSRSQKKGARKQRGL